MIFDAEQDAQMTPARTRAVAAQRSAAIVVLAIAASILVFVVAGLLLLNQRSSGFAPDQSRMTLIVIAVLLALSSIALRRTQFSTSRIQAVVTQRGVDGLIRHFFTITLIIAAIAEALGILAILIARFGGAMLDVITFGLVAGIILLSNFPRRAAWERAVDFFVSNHSSRIG